MTSSGEKAALNYGRTHPEHDVRYEIAEEFVDVVRGLWDCWDDGAVVRELETGRYIDPAKVKPLDHEGRFFTVKGPLPTSRTPQGQPIILQAGSSGPGLALAARTADVVFSVVQDLTEAQQGYIALKSRMPAFGRQPDEIAVLPGVMPVLGSTTAEAREKLSKLRASSIRAVHCRCCLRGSARMSRNTRWMRWCRTCRCRTARMASPVPCWPRRCATA